MSMKVSEDSLKGRTDLFRRFTGMVRALPEFMIIGGQKCGTTSLFAYLIQHPQVVPPLKKEVHFFDHKFNKGLNWYRSHFPLRSELKREETRLSQPVITGEASPTYMFHPHAPSRLKECMPNLKLIMLLRDPVERAYSHYNHKVRRNLESLSFEEAIEKESERLAGEMEKMQSNPKYDSRDVRHFSYLARGLYLEQIKRVEAAFDRSQILVIQSERFYTQFETVYTDVLDFLGLAHVMPEDAQAKNTGQYSKISTEMRTKLQEYFKPHNRALFEYLRWENCWE